MADRPHRGEIDHEKLGAYLRALSVPTRILLLEQLRWPRTASEIELPAFRKDRGMRPDRPLSRQAVEGHLEKLREVGLVRTRARQRDGQRVKEYLVNASRLFVVVDELRRLSRIRPPPGAREGWSRSVEGTVSGEGDERPVELPSGPALVHVTGPDEGTSIALEGKGPWIIGRDPEVAVPVTHDPFVSARNSEVARVGDRHVLRDLPSSSNGTTLNWRLVSPNERAPLAPGDTIGVGRTLLVLRVP